MSEPTPLRWRREASTSGDACYIADLPDGGTARIQRANPASRGWIAQVDNEQVTQPTGFGSATTRYFRGMRAAMAAVEGHLTKREIPMSEPTPTARVITDAHLRQLCDTLDLDRHQQLATAEWYGALPEVEAGVEWGVQRLHLDGEVIVMTRQSAKAFVRVAERATRIVNRVVYRSPWAPAETNPEEGS